MANEEKEYKVEHTHVQKSYRCVTVLATSKKEAIEKVKKSDLDLDTADEYETASQSEWIASNKFSLSAWLRSVLS